MNQLETLTQSTVSCIFDLRMNPTPMRCFVLFIWELSLPVNLFKCPWVPCHRKRPFFPLLFGTSKKSRQTGHGYVNRKTSIGRTKGSTMILWENDKNEKTGYRELGRDLRTVRKTKEPNNSLRLFEYTWVVRMYLSKSPNEGFEGL